MVNQAGNSKRNQPRPSTRKSYSVRGDSSSANRNAKLSDKPKFNSNNSKSSTSSNSATPSRYKKKPSDADGRASFRKPSAARTDRKRTVDAKGSNAGTRSDRNNRDRQDAGGRTSARKTFERTQTSARRTGATSRTERSNSERNYQDRIKPRTSGTSVDSTRSVDSKIIKGRFGERRGRSEFKRDAKPGDRTSTKSSGGRTKRDGIEKSRSTSDRDRGGRGRDQDRPQKFDIPRRFRGDLPRRERDQRARGNAPVIDDDITGDELGDQLNAELRSLPTGLTITVAQHLVMTQRYLEINPELALLHATHAKELAGRFPLVREIVGVAQYVNGNWQEALNDFRAVKRMAIADHLVPLMADCERGLGRPAKAIAFLAENRHLTGVDRIEAAIVEAGARSDLEQNDAALVALKIPALTGFPADQTAYARLCFAYAGTLAKLNQVSEALNWYRKADSADPGATDAAQFLTDAQDAIYLDDLDAEADN